MREAKHIKKQKLVAYIGEEISTVAQTLLNCYKSAKVHSLQFYVVKSSTQLGQPECRHMSEAVDDIPSFRADT